MLFVTAFSVLRQGEVLGLIWDCVDFEKGTLLINKQYNKVKGDPGHRFTDDPGDRL